MGGKEARQHLLPPGIPAPDKADPEIGLT